jgi:hypothetical protein
MHNYMQESLTVVNSLNILEPFRDKPTFVDGNITSHINFLLEDPFSS